MITIAHVYLVLKIHNMILGCGKFSCLRISLHAHLYDAFLLFIDALMGSFRYMANHRCRNATLSALGHGINNWAIYY